MKLNLKDYANKDVIKFLREYGSMTQKDLANYLNKSVRTVQRYEKGDIGIDLETIRSICQLYDLNLIIEGIKQYSSDTSFYQILVSAKMWQSPAGRDVFQEKSDKLIRQEFNQLFADELQNKQSESGPKL